MTIGVLDKDGNPQTIKTADDLAALIGALSDSAQTNPAAASATLLALTRGMLSILSSGIDPSVAHDDPDSGSPPKIGFKAVDSLSAQTLVAAGDRSNAYGARDGALFMRRVPLNDIIDGSANLSDAAPHVVLAASGAGLKNYLGLVLVSNTSGTACSITFSDGTTSRTVPVGPNGAIINLGDFTKGFAANTDVSATLSASLSSVNVWVLGFKSKI